MANPKKDPIPAQTPATQPTQQNTPQGQPAATAPVATAPATTASATDAQATNTPTAATPATGSSYTPLVNQMVSSNDPRGFRDKQVEVNQEHLDQNQDILNKDYAAGLTSNITVPQGSITYNAGDIDAALQQGRKVEQRKDENGNTYYYISSVDRSNNPKGDTNGDNANLSDSAWLAIYGEGGYEDQWEALEAKKATATQAELEEINKQQNTLHVNAEALRYNSGGIAGGYLAGTDGSMHLGSSLFGSGSSGGSSGVSSGGSSGGSGGSTGNLTWQDFLNSIGGTGSSAATTLPGSSELLEQMKAQMPNTDADALVSQWKENIPSVDQAKDSQKTLLDQLKQSMIDQSTGQIDYAVAKAITELERALADAQPQYKEQQESIAKDERQALDNSALYAEARGDKGGIGQEQYNSIMNTAAQNRLSVQQAQTKLSTDTQRQIADLRAQGEFDKADALLSINQQYLSQLLSLEQWALDYGLTTAQFKASLDQWAADYKMAVAQFSVGLDQWAANYDLSLAQYQTGVDQWNKNFAYQQYRDQVSDNQWQQNFNQNVAQQNWQNTFNQQQFNYNKSQDAISNDMSWAQILGVVPSTGQQTLNYQQYLYEQNYNQQKTMADQGLAMAQAGLPVSPLQYEAIKAIYNQDKSYVDSIISAAKLAAQSGTGSGTIGSGVAVKDMGADQIYDYLFQRGYTPETSEDEIVSDLMSQGLSETAAKRHYKAFVNTTYNDVYDYYAAESIPTEYRDMLMRNFPGGVIDGEGRWESWAAKFGEEALLAAGFTPGNAINFARYLYNSTKNPDYVYETLKSSGYSDIMIDYLMAKLGL